MYELMVESSFGAAHQLRGYEGPCEKLHGHTFRVQLFVQGKEVDRLGMVADFKALKQKLAAVLKEFDHSFLNELEYFKKINPTAENIARILYQLLCKELPDLAKITVWESDNSCATYYE